MAFIVKGTDIVGAASQGGSGGASALSQLSDVNLSSPSNKESLIYDSASGKWVNGNADFHEYSTNEKVVGEWIDGKPIYERTWHFPNGFTINKAVWADSPINNDNMEKIIEHKELDSSGTNIPSFLVSRTNTTYIQFYNYSNNNFTIHFCTLQYTKTTDAPQSIF